MIKLLGKKILSKKSIVIILILLVIVGVVFINIKNKDVDLSVAKDNYINVKVKEVEEKTIFNSSTYSSRVEARKDVMVVPKVPGKVIKVYHKLGDKVKKNDVLYKVDSVDIYNQIKGLQAQLDAANVGVKMAKLGLDSAKGSKHESQITQLEAALTSSKLQYEDAKKNYEDMKELYESGGISDQTFTKVKSGLEQLKIKYDSSKTAYDLYVNKMSKESVQIANDQYNKALSQKKAIEAQLALAKSSLRETSVKAPISGIVAEVNVKEGQMIASTASFRIVDMDSLIVKLSVSESIINKLYKDMEVELEVPSADKIVKGKIIGISPAASINTSGYPIEISIVSEENIVKPGMFVKVNFDIEKQENAIVIDRDCILNDGDTEFVYVVDNNRAKKIVVTTGIDNGKEIQILSGINVNDKVIIKGQKYVSDNSNVKVVE